MPPIFIIPCGGKKRNMPTFAGSMYLGSYFKACLTYALRRTDKDYIFILSAKYGLLRLTDKIQPYNLRMGNPNCVTGEQVRTQATHLGIAHAEDITALGGKEYLGVCRDVWNNLKTTGAEGLPIGKQLQWLQRNA